MEMELPALLTLNETIEGVPSVLEIRQEVDESEVISHLTLKQEGKDDRLYTMRFITCNEGPTTDEPRWQFVDADVPADLKDIEWTISEAIVEKDM